MEWIVIATQFDNSKVTWTANVRDFNNDPEKAFEWATRVYTSRSKMTDNYKHVKLCHVLHGQNQGEF